MNQILSQGDVVFIPATNFTKKYLAKFKKKKADGVLAMGQVTGNSHRLEGKYQVLEGDDGFLIKAKLAKVTHQEHEDFEIKGDYVAVIQHEVDHFEKTLRRVVD